jgi:hypothetical protein
MFLAIPCHAGISDWIKGIISPEINALKASVTGDVNGVKADIAKLADVQVKMSNKMDTAIDGIAGVNNKITKTSAGRDNIQTTTTTNDATMIATLGKTFTNGYTYIIGLLLIYVRMLSVQRSKVEKQLFDLIGKQEEAQGKYIAMLEKIANQTLDKLWADKSKGEYHV